MRLSPLTALGALVVLFAGCKPKMPTEDWARAILVTRAANLSEIEYPAVSALETYDAKTAADPSTRADNARELAKTLKPLLEKQNWITGFGPVTVTTDVGGQDLTTRLEIEPHIPVTTVEGGSEHMPGIAVPPRQQLYWGVYRTKDDSYGGVEIQSVLRKGHSALTLHLYVVPGVSQQSAR